MVLEIVVIVQWKCGGTPSLPRQATIDEVAAMSALRAKMGTPSDNRTGELTTEPHG